MTCYLDSLKFPGDVNSHLPSLFRVWCDNIFWTKEKAEVLSTFWVDIKTGLLAKVIGNGEL